MLKKHTQIFISLLRFIDIGIALGAWLCAYNLRFHSTLFSFSPVPPVKYYLFVLPVIVFVWTITFDIFKLYFPKRSISLWEEFFSIMKACLMATCILLGISFFYREHVYSRLVFLLFFIFDLFGTLGWRVFFRKLMRFLRQQGFNLKNVLIVGAGETGLRVAHKIADNPWAGFRFVGWIDDYIPEGRIVDGKKIYGNITKLSAVIAEYEIDQIFITLPIRAYRRLLYVLKMLEVETVDVRIVPNIYQALTLNASIEDFDGMPLINLSENPIYGWNRVLKRLLDIMIAFVGLIIAAPFLIIISFMVKLSSPGPIFFKQERFGIKGKKFSVYKIRSMVVGDPKIADTKQASVDDPRITPVGKIIRRFSLDELPQLLNVLKGDMSLVGPRPHPVYLDEQHRSRLDTYMWRYKVKPGITGWAQVNGWRGETDTLEKMKKRIEHDIYYIEHWSIWFDFKILWLTLIKLTYSKNAY